MSYQEIIEAAKTLHANQLEPLTHELREMLKWRKSLLPPSQEKQEEDYLKEIVPCADNKAGFKIIEYTNEGEHRLVLFCCPDGEDLVYSLYKYEDYAFQGIVEHVGEGWLEAFTPIIQEFFKHN